MDSSKKTLSILLVGRDDWQREDPFFETLMQRLESLGYPIVWEMPSAKIRYKLRRLQHRWPWFPLIQTRMTLRITQLIYGIAHPNYLWNLYQRRCHSISQRGAYLKKIVEKLQRSHELIILSRSAGGRISSLIADELKIKQLICLGYPFQHPQMGDEPERYQHLAHLKTPMLIIQGTRDEYGGSDCQQRYQMSPAIEVWFVDTNHNFDLNQPDILRLVNKIKSVITGV